MYEIYEAGRIKETMTGIIKKDGAENRKEEKKNKK